MEQSLVSQILIQNALAPAAYNSKTEGEIIDSAKFESLTFVAHVFAFTGDITLSVEHADDNAGTFVDVEDGDIIYPESLQFTGTGIKQFGYIGKKEFVRVNFSSGDGSVAIYATKGHPKRVPTVGSLSTHQFPV